MAGPGEFDELGPRVRGDPVGRGSAAVAVDEVHRVGDVAGQQAPDLTCRESEDPGRLVDADVASHHVLEDEGAMLRPPIRVWVSPFHASDGDKVAGRLARTESMADDMPARSSCQIPGRHVRFRQPKGGDVQ
jgi:hypothetical protein